MKGLANAMALTGALAGCGPTTLSTGVRFWPTTGASEPWRASSLGYIDAHYRQHTAPLRTAVGHIMNDTVSDPGHPIAVRTWLEARLEPMQRTRTMPFVNLDGSPVPLSLEPRADMPRLGIVIATRDAILNAVEYTGLAIFDRAPTPNLMDRYDTYSITLTNHTQHPTNVMVRRARFDIQRQMIASEIDLSVLGEVLRTTLCPPVLSSFEQSYNAATYTASPPDEPQLCITRSRDYNEVCFRTRSNQLVCGMDAVCRATRAEHYSGVVCDNQDYRLCLTTTPSN